MQIVGVDTFSKQEFNGQRDRNLQGKAERSDIARLLVDSKSQQKGVPE